MKTTVELPDELLRAAQRTARREGTTVKSLLEEGLRLAAAMFLHWRVRSAYREGRGHLERALRRASRTPTSARAMALIGAGWLAFQHGDREAAAPLLTEGLAVAQTAGDRVSEAVAMAFRSAQALEQGDLERSTAGMKAALVFASAGFLRVLQRPDGRPIEF